MKKVTLFVLSLGLMFGAFAQGTLTRNGVEKSAFLTSKYNQVSFSPAKTAVKDGELTFSEVTVEEQDDSFHATVTIDMGTATKYYLGVYQANAVENYVDTSSNFSTMEEYFQYMVDYYLGKGYTEAQVYRTEGGEVTFSGFNGNSSYEFYAFTVYEDGTTAVVTKTFTTPSSVVAGTPAVNSFAANCDAASGTIDWQINLSNTKFFYFLCESVSDLDQYYGEYIEQYGYEYVFVYDFVYYWLDGYASSLTYINEDELNEAWATYLIAGKDADPEYVNGEEYYAAIYPFNGNGETMENAPSVINFIFGQVSLNDVAQMAVSVYPNPAAETLTINGDKINRVELYNELGQVVYSSAAHNGMNISLAGFAAGTYVVKAYADGATATSKVVVK